MHTSLASRFRSALLLFLLLPLAAFALETPAPAPALGFDRTQSLTTLDIIDRLGRYHYAKVPIDDALSQRLLDNYLHNLDPSRSVLLQSDIDEFRTFSTELDDQLRDGDLSAGFRIYARYRDRLAARLENLTATLPAMLAAMDFTKDEVMIVDREKLPWPASQAEADNVWRQQIKASVLRMKLANEKPEAIERVLQKRYREQLRRLSQVNSEDVYQLYMNSFTELFDPHTNYLSPRSSENFNMSMRLSLQGIGAVLQQEDEFTKVARLVPGGPAAKQGELRPADRIVSVRKDLTSEPVDVTGWRLDDVVDMIRGEKGTTVRLEVVRGSGAGEEHKVIDIVRDNVKLEEQAAKSRVLELKDGNGASRKVGVIDLPGFYSDFEARQRGDPDYRSTTRDVSKLLGELQQQKVEGIVIDLRENGGGSLDEANELTGLFIESGFTVQIRHSSAPIERKQKFRGDTYYTGPLVILVNRLSASASEIFAGAIQDYGRGLIVGTQTFGKGTVQAMTDLNHGELKLTESKFYRISGESTQHRGVLPDIELPTIYDLSEVGESVLHNALPWDRIAPVRHRVYEDVTPLLDPLRSRHEERTRNDPDFKYLKAELALIEKRDAANTLSLNEQVRVQERKQMREEELKLENEKRIGKGEKPFASVEEMEKDAKARNEKHADAEADPENEDDADAREEQDAKDDVLLTESGRILLDSIDLRQRIARSN